MNTSVHHPPTGRSAAADRCPYHAPIGTSFGGIDFSPLIVIIGLQLLAGIIC